MKKWTKKILAAVLCLMMLQMPAAEPLIAVQTVSKEYMENRDCR